ncbi:MAG: DUF5655 domain-containing protein [Candidatus Woesearchaeota archaeon]
MYLFQKLKTQSKPVEEIKFQSEAEIHEFVSSNLDTVFGLEFVASEFTIKNLRIDSLAFDKETNSFVIIEYKNTKSFSVVDQGIAYLSTMLNNKADFILEFNEKSDEALTRSNIDWSQSRVIFISPFFNNYQKEALNFKDLPIELWQIKKFKNNLVLLNQVNLDNPTESFNKIASPSSEVKKVRKEIKVYDESDHLEDKPEEIKELYEQIKDYILSLDGNIKVKATKLYISFIYKKKILVDITPLKSKIKLWLNAPIGSINDEKNLYRDVTNTGHWGNGDYETSISDDRYFEYLMSHIKDIYNEMRNN